MGKIIGNLGMDLGPVMISQDFGIPESPTPYPLIIKRQMIVCKSLYF
jgi:hypothetical protein